MTTLISDAELDAMAARCDAASPAPWISYIEGRDHTAGSNVIIVAPGTKDRKDIELSGASMEDQDFIAHARQDIPRLLAEVRRLRRQKTV